MRICWVAVKGRKWKLLHVSPPFLVHLRMRKLPRGKEILVCFTRHLSPLQVVCLEGSVGVPFLNLCFGLGALKDRWACIQERSFSDAALFWRRRATCMDPWVHAPRSTWVSRPFLLAIIDNWGLITLEMLGKDKHMTWGPDSRGGLHPWGRDHFVDLTVVLEAPWGFSWSSRPSLIG